MPYTVNILGDGTSADPYRPDVSRWDSWQDNGDGTATVELSEQAEQGLLRDASTMAIAMNQPTTSFADAKAAVGGAFGKLHEQKLFEVKKKWANVPKPLPAGVIVAHDNGTTKGLWRTDTETSAEPATDSADWTLLYETV